MLEAILFLRVGFSSSLPKLMFEPPPGGRRTLEHTQTHTDSDQSMSSPATQLFIVEPYSRMLSLVLTGSLITQRTLEEALTPEDPLN